jgi:hypothetical protein
MTRDKIIVRYTNQDGKMYNERTILTTQENYYDILNSITALAPMMSCNHPLMDGMIEIEYDGDQQTRIRYYRNGQNINDTAKAW